MSDGLQVLDCRNPAGFDLGWPQLSAFEAQLDPASPETCPIASRVLGYGEISTVFEVQVPELAGVALKRMAVFQTMQELEAYLKTYQEYHRVFEEEIGLHVPAHGYAVLGGNGHAPIFYIVQQKLNPQSIGSKAIHILPREDVLRMTAKVFQELCKVWTFNKQSKTHAVGIDGQMSNWVLRGFDPAQPILERFQGFMYLDTSTPFIRINGEEQLNTELFLRVAPSYLAWVLRLFFLQDVMDRYYDFRKVIVDLIANFYKEQRPDLIPDLVQMANDFLANQQVQPGLEPITEKEVHAYYREDALIWTLYLSMRKFDRFLFRTIYRRPYPYILPGKVKR